MAVPAPLRVLTGNERAFTAMVRNALFRRVELFARRRWDDLGELDGASGWAAGRWEELGLPTSTNTTMSAPVATPAVRRC